jgi:hypothetical protein
VADSHRLYGVALQSRLTPRYFRVHGWIDDGCCYSGAGLWLGGVVEGHRFFFSCGSGGRYQNTYPPRCIDITVTRLARPGIEIGAVGDEVGGDDDL